MSYPAGHSGKQVGMSPALVSNAGTFMNSVKLSPLLQRTSSQNLAKKGGKEGGNSEVSIPEVGVFR